MKHLPFLRATGVNLMPRLCPVTIYVTVTDVTFWIHRATGAVMELPSICHRTFRPQEGANVLDYIVRDILYGVRMKGATHELLEEGDWIRDGAVVGKSYRLDVTKKDDGKLFRRFLFSLCDADMNRDQSDS